MPTKKPLIGAAIVGQSGGPSSVINASAYGVIKTALEDENITKVYGAEHGIVGVLEDRLMIMDEEDPAELALYAVLRPRLLPLQDRRSVRQRQGL